MNLKFFAVSTVFALSILAIAGEVTFDFKCNKETPFCKAGEKITITAQALVDGKPSDKQKISCYLTFNDKHIKSLRKVYADKPYTFEYTPDSPGWIALRVYAVDEKGKRLSKRTKRRRSQNIYGGYGLMVDADKLTQSVPEPADFDEFWNKVKAELALESNVVDSNEVLDGILHAADILGVGQHGDDGGVPVVAVDDLGHKVKHRDGIQHGS